MARWIGPDSVRDMKKALGAFLPILLVALVVACDDDEPSEASAPGADAAAPSQNTPDGGPSSQQPPSMEVDPAPEQGLYVADYRGSIVHMSLDDGTVYKTYGTEGTGEHQFIQPAKLAATKKHLYIADYGNRRLVRLDRLDGTGWKAWTPGEGIEPYGVAAFLSEDEKEEIVAFSDYAGMQFLYAPEGFAGAPVVGAKLKFNTCGVALSKTGGAAGSAGCSSGPALSTIVHPRTGEQVYTGGLTRPDSLAYLPDGTLVIGDLGSKRVVCVKGASAGNFGKPGSEGDLEFQSVDAVATDLRGRIYVGDATRNRIVRVDDCNGASPKVLWDNGSEIDQLTGLVAVGPYLSVRNP